MIVYVPVYDGKRTSAAIDSEKARYLHTPGYSPSILYYGTIYNGSDLFTNEKAVFAWWGRDFKNYESHRIEAEKITWKEFKA